MPSDKYDDLVRVAVAAFFPELEQEFNGFGWLWIKALIWQESSFNPMAVSHCGAMGLTQLMPATAKQLGVKYPYDPEQSIDGGVRYLARQYRRLGEIPDTLERLKFALASYNGGRGYVNKALSLSRAGDGLPASYTMWKLRGRPSGEWQRWAHSKYYLQDPKCRVRGRTPDANQMIHYVDRIIVKERKLMEGYASC